MNLLHFNLNYVTPVSVSLDCGGKKEVFNDKPKTS